MADRDKTHRPLPPPPAPTAPDANPWTISSQVQAVPHRTKMPAPGTVGTRASSRERRHGLRRLVPFVIFAAVVSAFIAAALEEARAGDLAGAVVPLVFLGIIVLGWWRSLRREHGRDQ